MRVQISDLSGFFSRTTPNRGGQRLYRGYTKKFDFAVDEGKGVLNPSRGKKEKASTAEKRGELKTDLKKKSPVGWLAFLLCDPGWRGLLL